MCSGLGSFSKGGDGSPLQLFPRTCWLEEVPRLDGDDLKLVALRSFRDSEKTEEKEKKTGSPATTCGCSGAEIWREAKRIVPGFDSRGCWAPATTRAAAPCSRSRDRALMLSRFRETARRKRRKRRRRREGEMERLGLGAAPRGSCSGSGAGGERGPAAVRAVPCRCLSARLR